jgi:hypothetical protein
MPLAALVHFAIPLCFLRLPVVGAHPATGLTGGCIAVALVDDVDAVRHRTYVRIGALLRAYGRRTGECSREAVLGPLAASQSARLGIEPIEIPVLQRDD